MNPSSAAHRLAAVNVSLKLGDSPSFHRAGVLPTPAQEGSEAEEYSACELLRRMPRVWEAHAIKTVLTLSRLLFDWRVKSGQLKKISSAKYILPQRL